MLRVFPIPRNERRLNAVNWIYVSLRNFRRRFLMKCNSIRIDTAPISFSTAQILCPLHSHEEKLCGAFLPFKREYRFWRFELRQNEITHHQRTIDDRDRQHRGSLTFLQRARARARARNFIACTFYASGLDVYASRFCNLNANWR